MLRFKTRKPGDWLPGSFFLCDAPVHFARAFVEGEHRDLPRWEVIEEQPVAMQ